MFEVRGLKYAVLRHLYLWLVYKKAGLVTWTSCSGKNLELQNGANVSEGVEHAAGSNRHLEIMLQKHIWILLFSETLVACPDCAEISSSSRAIQAWVPCERQCIYSTFFSKNQVKVMYCLKRRVQTQLFHSIIF